MRIQSRCAVAAMIVSAGALLNARAPAYAYDFNGKKGTATVTSVADFTRCQEAVGYGDACLDGLSAYIKAHPAEAFAAGKQVRLQFNHWVALRFFELTVDKANDTQCADEDLGMALVSGLALPADQPGYKSALKVAKSRCWAALQPRLVKELAEDAGYYREHACPLLKEKGVSASLAGVNPRTLPVDSATAMLFRGPETEEVVFARAKANREDVVMLKLKNVRGPWNNQIFATIETPASLGGKDYVANVDGSDWVIMTVREGDYEVYPKGYKDGLHVYRTALAEHVKPANKDDVAKEFGGAAPAAPATAKK
jgi:hypothetical protein